MLVKLLLLFTCLTLVSCADKKVKPDTPENLAMLVKYAINQNDLNDLNKYFADGRKEVISKMELSELSEVTTAGAEIRTYSFLKMENGEIFLIDIIKDRDGLYKAQDFIRVPNHSVHIFNENK
jgi:hypothetical protein